MRKICFLWMMLTFFLLPVGAAEEESLSAKDNEKRVEVTDTLFVRHLFLMLSHCNAALPQRPPPAPTP